MARPSIRFFPFAFVPCPLSAPRLTRLPLRPVRPASRTAGTYRPFGSGPSGVNSTPKYTTKSSSSTISILLRPTSLILIFVPILTGFLGVWQLKRLRWKLDLIEEVDRNLHKEPMLLPANINLDALPEFAFRRVLIKGHFDGPPILLGPQTYEGFPGYHLILPFLRSDGGSTLLVNRGFITTTRANAIRAGTQVPPGLTLDKEGKLVGTGEEVVLEGLLPKTGEKTVWMHENKPETNEWFWKDVEKMAEVAGGEEKGVQPVLVDVIAEPDQSPTLLMQQGIPVGRPAHVELRNQHAQYAAIWLSLSASTTVMLGYILTRGKGKPKTRRPKLY
ncbi:mitochondrial protein required for respiration [Cryptococcus gattii Ru294]|nr:mitochondrial protein required for respiration [Cryptococcus gattii Ru294]